MNDCKTEICLYQREYEEAILGNTQLQHPVHCGIYTKIFNKVYPFLAFNQAAIVATFPMLLLETIKNMIKKSVPDFLYKQIFKFYKWVKN